MEIERQIYYWKHAWNENKGYYLNIDVKYFNSTEEMFDYVKDPSYMTDSNNQQFDDKAKRGLCFGISMVQSSKSDQPSYREYSFHLHFEDQPKSGY